MMPQERAASSGLGVRAGRARRVALAALGSVWLLSSCSLSPARPSGAARAAFEERTGVRVVRVALTGGGGLVDLRYQVIDPEKAAAVHLTVPHLVVEDTGQVIDALFMGHAHGGRPRAGSTYPLLFVNSRRAVHRGGTVSVVVGDSRLEHVAVR